MAIILFAHQIGSTAYAAIFDPDRSWSVLASVSGAIYIESDAGEILWVAARSSALQSRAILLSHMPTELPTVGAKCSLEDGCLRVGASLLIRLSNAEVWAPEVLVPEGMNVSRAAENLMTAISQAATQPPTVRGLLTRALLPHDSQLDRHSLNAIDQALLQAASRAIESLCHVSTRPELREWLKDAIDLVGLGHGLTPSGDDLLGAFLYTLHVLDSAHLGLIETHTEVVDRWLQQVRSRTNKISFAILADHAHGDAAAPLHELLNAAFDGESLEHLVRVAGRVSAVGQSSGWDMLAGVHCACTVVSRMATCDPEECCISPSGRGAREMRREDEHLKEVVHVC